MFSNLLRGRLRLIPLGAGENGVPFPPPEMLKHLLSSTKRWPREESFLRVGRIEASLWASARGHRGHQGPSRGRGPGAFQAASRPAGPEHPSPCLSAAHGAIPHPGDSVPHSQPPLLLPSIVISSPGDSGHI